MSLKTRNLPILVAFVVVQLATFGVVSAMTTLERLTELAQRWSTLGAMAIGTGLAVALGEILPDQWKARLVFWRWTHPLPGCRAFTRYVHEDSDRIDTVALKQKYGRLPTDPVKQNRLWYRAYLGHREKPGVMQSQGRFLLLRDMTAILVALAIAALCVMTLGLLHAPRSYWYGAALAAQYVVLSRAASNAGIRFVKNVLAEESHTPTAPMTTTLKETTHP